MNIKANAVTDELVRRLSLITGPDYPIALASIERGQFYEDLPDAAALPVACIVPASSNAAAGQAMPQSAKRTRYYQIEIIFDFDHYPSVERDVLMTQVEWSLGKALGGIHSGRGLAGLATDMQLAEIEYGWPSTGHSIGTLTATLIIGYVENYQ